MKTTADGQVSVRQIAKTFASGKSAEKVVYSTLSECDLPCGKVNILYYLITQDFVHLKKYLYI